MTLHYRTQSPKYRAAKKGALTILDDFTEAWPLEIKYSDIMQRVKAMKIPYSGPDVADLAAQYLHEKVIKVWRYILSPNPNALYPSFSYIHT
ncbi:MAG: hypothetical protein ACTSQY_03040 [Candidatus Odinarchaeia archaeon]